MPEVGFEPTRAKNTDDLKSPPLDHSGILAPLFPVGLEPTTSGS